MRYEGGMARLFTENEVRKLIVEAIAPLPAEVAAAGLVGPRLSAAIAFQKAACHMSYTTIQAFCRDLAGLDLSRGRWRRASVAERRSITSFSSPNREWSRPTT